MQQDEHVHDMSLKRLERDILHAIVSPHHVYLSHTVFFSSSFHPPRKSITLRVLLADWGVHSHSQDFSILICLGYLATRYKGEVSIAHIFDAFCLLPFSCHILVKLAPLPQPLWLYLPPSVTRRAKQQYVSALGLFVGILHKFVHQGWQAWTFWKLVPTSLPNNNPRAAAHGSVRVCENNIQIFAPNRCS